MTKQISRSWNKWNEIRVIQTSRWCQPKWRFSRILKSCLRCSGIIFNCQMNWQDQKHAFTYWWILQTSNIQEDFWHSIPGKRSKIIAISEKFRIPGRQVIKPRYTPFHIASVAIKLFECYCPKPKISSLKNPIYQYLGIRTVTNLCSPYFWSL